MKRTPTENKILATISQMPFGALEAIAVKARVLREEPITLEGVADYLEALRAEIRQFGDEHVRISRGYSSSTLALRAEIRQFGDEHQETQKKLWQLEGDIVAGGRLLKRIMGTEGERK